MTTTKKNATCSVRTFKKQLILIIITIIIPAFIHKCILTIIFVQKYSHQKAISLSLSLSASHHPYTLQVKSKESCLGYIKLLSLWHSTAIQTPFPILSILRPPLCTKQIEKAESNSAQLLRFRKNKSEHFYYCITSYYCDCEKSRVGWGCDETMSLNYIFLHNIFNDDDEYNNGLLQVLRSDSRKDSLFQFR